jgi:pyruvate-formate lyase-activating enzyme
VPGLNDTDAHLAALVALTRTYPGLAGIEVMSYHRMGNEKARRTGSEVRLDQPDAGTAVREEWRRRFHALGCAGVILT